MSSSSELGSQNSPSPRNSSLVMTFQAVACSPFSVSSEVSAEATIRCDLPCVLTGDGATDTQGQHLPQQTHHVGPTAGAPLLLDGVTGSTWCGGESVTRSHRRQSGPSVATDPRADHCERLGVSSGISHGCWKAAWIWLVKVLGGRWHDTAHQP